MISPAMPGAKVVFRQATRMDEGFHVLAGCVEAGCMEGGCMVEEEPTGSLGAPAARSATKDK